MGSRLQILVVTLLLAISAPASARWSARRHGRETDLPRRAFRLRLPPHASRHAFGGTVRRRAVRPDAVTHDLLPVRAKAPPEPPACDGLEGRDIAIDAAKPIHLGLKTYPETLDLHDHEVVLTFDDGPSSATTPAVLDALRHDCVKATFFLIGRNAAANPALAKREFAEGHTVGHHSMTHPAVTLRRLDESAGERDIADGIAADERAVYGEAASGTPHVPFFRFPGFADTKHLLDYLDERHVAVFGTDLWAADWRPMTPDFERERVIGLLERSPTHSGIILFHDTRSSTARMLPAFLRELKAKGYKVAHLVPATPGDAPTPRRAAPDGWTSETEAIIARLRPSYEPGVHGRLMARRGARSRVADSLHRGRRHAGTAARSWSHRT